jgi:hypothetical protein
MSFRSSATPKNQLPNATETEKKTNRCDCNEYKQDTTKNECIIVSALSDFVYLDGYHADVHWDEDACKRVASAWACYLMRRNQIKFTAQQPLDYHPEDKYATSTIVRRALSVASQSKWNRENNNAEGSINGMIWNDLGTYWTNMSRPGWASMLIRHWAIGPTNASVQEKRVARSLRCRPCVRRTHLNIRLSRSAYLYASAVNHSLTNEVGGCPCLFHLISKLPNMDTQWFSGGTYQVPYARRD